MNRQIHRASSGRRPRTIQLVPDLRISNNGTTAFESISDVVPLQSGAIAVLDAAAQDIGIFSAEGRFIRTIGRSGSGPGEFSPGVRRVLPVAGDRLVVPDPGLARVQLFSADGRVQGYRNLEFPEGKPVSWSTNPSSASDAVTVGLRELPDPSSPQPGNQLTIVRLRVGNWVVTHTQSYQAGGTIAPKSHIITLLSAEPAWASVNDTEVVVGPGDQPVLVVRDWGGVTRHTIGTDRDRVLVSKSDREIVLDLFLRQLAGNGLPRAALDQVRKTLAVADYYPLYTRIVSDGFQRVWIQRAATAEELQRDSITELTARHLGSHQWDVYSIDGQYDGTIRLPAGLMLTWLRSDTLYGVTAAEDGSQAAVRYRVSYGDSATGK